MYGELLPRPIIPYPVNVPAIDLTQTEQRLLENKPDDGVSDVTMENTNRAVTSTYVTPVTQKHLSKSDDTVPRDDCSPKDNLLSDTEHDRERLKPPTSTSPVRCETRPKTWKSTGNSTCTIDA